MPWEIDDSQPLIYPESALSYYSQLMAVDRDSLALPPLLVATFQKQALDHMVTLIGAEAPTRWPTPILWPVARATFREKDLAVARLPIGAPAAAAALELMIAAGVRTILLVGSAGSLQPDLPIGSVIIATSAIRHEGTSHHYLSPDRDAHASAELVDALASAMSQQGGRTATLGPVWTTDAPYRECTDTVSHMRGTGVLAVEMEAAAIFAIALHRGTRAALVAAISDELGAEWRPGFHTLAFRRALLAASNAALDAAVHLK